jgi:hypothetical protein
MQIIKTIVCSDLKALEGLVQKRVRLEKTSYAGARPGTIVNHADLFREFFRQHDRLGFELIILRSNETESTENKILLPVLGEVQRHARETLSNQIKGQTTQQITDKWF